MIQMIYINILLCCICSHYLLDFQHLTVFFFFNIAMNAPKCNFNEEIEQSGYDYGLDTVFTCLGLPN